MSRAKRGGSRGTGQAAWLTLQTELAPYETGVHWLSPPVSEGALEEATARLGALPLPLCEFYRRFGSARLFLDSYEVLPLDAVARHEDWLQIGVALGAVIFCTPKGEVRCEDEEGETMLAGATPLHWLCLVARREQLVFDKDGEFRDVFDDQAEGELKPAIRLKRAQLGRTHEPEAALYLFESALLSLDDGDETTALEQADEARRLDPLATCAHELSANLLEGQDPVAASAAWAVAGRVARHAPRGADSLGRAAVLAGPLHKSYARLAELALARDPGCVARWLSEAEHALLQRDPEVTQRLAKLAQAVATSEEDKRRATQLQLRASLRVV